MSSTQFQSESSFIEIAPNPSTFTFDENRNLVPLPHEKKEQKKDEKAKVLKPIISNVRRKGGGVFVVYNLFTDFGKLIGFRGGRKKKVRFPVEVIEHAELKGETSPDGNAVPLVNFPYRAVYSQKKSKVIRVHRGGEFKPKLVWIADTSKLEDRCEKIVTSCNCIGAEYQDPKAVLQAKAKNKRDNSKKGQLSKLTDSFMNHVNTADLFLIGHKQRTLQSALEDVDGSPPTDWVDPADSEEHETSTKMWTFYGFYVDELPPISTSQLGKLAKNIWIFGFCIPHLFTDEDKPTEIGFRKLMENFAGLGISADEASQNLVYQSRDFYNYSFEAMRVIRNLQLKIYLQGETSLNEPLCMGGGLHLLKKGSLDNRQQPEVLVANVGSSDEPIHFVPFEDLGITSKMAALKNLVLQTLIEFDHAKHQIDFLVEDIKETTMDAKNDQDLLYRLSEMYNCIINIQAKSKVNPEGKSGEEVQIICETMSKFVISLNSFVSASEHIMEKIMEVRDIIQLTYIFLQEEMKIDLAKLIPADNPIRIVSRSNIFNSSDSRCCRTKRSPFASSGKKGTKKKRKKVKRELTLPHYNGSDFNRIQYEEAFVAEDSSVDGFIFRVRPHLQKQPSKSHSLPKIAFRDSVLVPDDLMQLQDGSNPTFGNNTSAVGVASGDEISAEQALKPILKVNPNQPEMVEVQLPPDKDVPQIKSAEEICVQEDDEPIVERKGRDSVIFGNKKIKPIHKK